MQLSIDLTIQPVFTQHPVQRALYSLWQARFGRVNPPFGRHSPVTPLAPSYLKPVSLACLRQADVLFESPARR